MWLPRLEDRGRAGELQDGLAELLRALKPSDTRLCIRIYTYVLDVYIFLCTCICTFTLTYASMFLFICMNIHIHVYIHRDMCRLKRVCSLAAFVFTVDICRADQPWKGRRQPESLLVINMCMCTCM